MGRACSTNRGEEELVEAIGGKAIGKGPLGRSRRRWVNNIKTDLGELARREVLTGLVLLRIGISGGLLRMR
jgi:hypothetical protein